MTSSSSAGTARARSIRARDDITLQILDSLNRPVLVVPEESG